jgi:hypothetical protein
MHRLLLSLLILSLLITKPSLSSDFQKGLKAFNDGDFQTAIKVWKPLAEQGDGIAQYNLGLLYEKGRGVTQDHQIAFRWYSRAAEDGIPQAQLNLGELYRRGLGVPKNHQQAVKWYRRAALQGNAAARTNLGVMYLHGVGVDQDVNAAREWFSRAAKQGYAKAQNYLARFDKEFGVATSRSSKPTNLKSSGISIGTQTKKTEIEKDAFPVFPLNVRFPKSMPQPDDVAVIIGNANYKNLGKDIPNVTPAYADAAGFKNYVLSKGVREGNIIHLKDATSGQLESVFGNERSHKGQLFNWTKPNASNIYVYYAGHGAPDTKDGTAYLVPSDATSGSIALTGYPLAQLYNNLGNIPAKSITVVLEACFSGTTHSGTLFQRSSGINVTPKAPGIGSKITVISAGALDQIATWEQDSSHSLFTKYFLKGMSGEGDKMPYGNGDGAVSLNELEKYLGGTMTYLARRYYGRDQRVQIVKSMMP